jgi:hypothetical protein
MKCLIPRLVTEYLAPSELVTFQACRFKTFSTQEQTEVCATALRIQTRPPKTYARLSQIFSNPPIES